VDLSFERPGNHHHIRSVSAAGICIGNEHYSKSIIVSAKHIIDHWPPAKIDDLTDEHFVSIFDLNPELVLLGTGNKQHFLSAKMMVQFYQHQTGLEVMTTDAACRTFNILVAEGRNVVAALIQEGHL